MIALAMLSAVMAPSPERIALVVGQGRGLPNEAPLRYAELDAERIGTVLEELGDFSLVIRVSSPSAAELEARLAALPAQPELLLFYYSGHAGRGDLHLAGETVSGQRVLERLDAARPQLRIAIVDACDSGDLVRAKGLSARAIEQPEPAGPEGRVLLAASSPGQAAQESDTLQGSFFTSHLVSGLRGAADGNEDGRVTLRELFQHARDRTLSDTVFSAAGLQRPSYQMHLSGEAEVVLARRSDAQLALEADGAGRYLVLNAHSGQLAAEVTLSEASQTRLSLPAGAYVVEKRESGRALVAQVRLSKAGTTHVSDREMEAVPLLSASAGKGGPSGVLTVGAVAGAGWLGADLGVGVELGWSLAFDRLSVWPSVRAVVGRSPHAEVAAIDVGLGLTADLNGPRWRLYLGLRPGAAVHIQDLGPLGQRTGTAGRLEAIVGGDAWISNGWGLFAQVSGGAVLAERTTDPRVGDASLSLSPAYLLTAGLRWR